MGRDRPFGRGLITGHSAGRPPKRSKPDPPRCVRCDVVLVDWAETKKGKMCMPCSVEPDRTASCEVCGKTPVMPITGMCGPCTTGEADTADGEW